MTEEIELSKTVQIQDKTVCVKLGTNARMNRIKAFFSPKRFGFFV